MKKDKNEDREIQRRIDRPMDKMQGETHRLENKEK